MLYISKEKFANSWNGLFNCKSLEITYRLCLWHFKYSDSVISLHHLFADSLFFISMNYAALFISKHWIIYDSDDSSQTKWMIMIHHHDASYSLNFFMSSSYSMPCISFDTHLSYAYQWNEWIIELMSRSI